MFYTIYKITNNTNGKYYIGKHQSQKLDDGYMGSGKLIRRAIEKYGIENFTKDILFIFDNEEDMNAKEKELVVVSEETYNLNEGGHGGFGFINREGLNNSKRTEQTKIKHANSISRARKEKCKDPLEREKMKIISCKGIQKIRERFPEGTWKGRKHKQESREAIGKKNSISQKGKSNSQYGTCWITNGTENKKIKKEELDKWTFLGYYKGRM